jgi:glycosyltransferase involved in cell wall biosynthesis
VAQDLSRKINVLEVHATLGYAGGQRNMVTFAKYLSRDIFSVIVGTYQGGGALESELQKLSIPYVLGNGSILKLLEVIKNNKIDILHIHRSGGSVPIETNLVQQAKKINPNIVIIEKNVFGKYDPTLDGRIDCSLFQSMMHVQKRYLPASNKELDFSTMKVMYNNVDGSELEKFRASTQEIIDFKTRLGISPDDFIFGKVARPAIEKWSDLIINMVPYLVKLNSHIKVVIIGCPPSRIKRIEKSRYRSYFCFIPETNNQKELHLFYQTINVLAHCSKIGECNGNTINEAMYWKKPVVTNSTPRKDNGQLEQIINGLNGYIANSPLIFARALAFLASHKDKCEEFGEAGFRQTQSVNDPKKNTLQLEKIFIEKCHNKIGNLSLLLASKYAKVKYYPSEDNIKKFPLEYQKRLAIEYQKQTFIEKIFFTKHIPKMLFYKIKDFLDHKLLSYARR